MSQTEVSAIGERLDAVVPRILERFTIPGIAVGVSDHGVNTLRGYGVTSLENPLLVDELTIFQIGSISKTLLGVVIARLVERGDLDLDEPVAAILPAIGIDGRITTRHLMTHTSGIDAQNMIGDAPRILRANADDSLSASFAHFLDQPIRFAPGTEYSYSGPGIMVAAAVVEAKTGRPYVEVLNELALRPANMTHTYTTADEVITYRVAAPHGTENGAARVLHDEGWQRHWQLPGWDVPGGGVLSNVRDLMRYGEYLMSPSAPPYVFDVHGKQDSITSSGLDWYLSEIGGELLASHGGLTVGYASNLSVIPSRKLAFAVLTNSLQGFPAARLIALEIEHEILGFDDMPALDQRIAADLDDFVGSYDFGFYGTSTIEKVDEDHLRLVSNPATGDEDQFFLDPPSADLMVVYSAEFLMVLEPEAQRGSLIRYLRDPDGVVSALNNGRHSPRVGDRTELGE